MIAIYIVFHIIYNSFIYYLNNLIHLLFENDSFLNKYQRILNNAGKEFIKKVGRLDDDYV